MRNISILIIHALTLIGISMGCHASGIIVQIQNRSMNDINQLTLEFTGGKEVVPILEPGAETTRRIVTTGESSLTLSYFSGKNTYRKNIDIYIEPSSKGSLFIKIYDNGEIISRSEIGL